MRRNAPRRSTRLRKTFSSSSVGIVVTGGSSFTTRSNPVASRICSNVTPGWIDLTRIAFVEGSKSNTPSGDSTNFGPPGGNPMRSREVSAFHVARPAEEIDTRHEGAAIMPCDEHVEAFGQPAQCTNANRSGTTQLGLGLLAYYHRIDVAEAIDLER